MCVVAGVEMVDTTAALSGSSRNLAALSSPSSEENPLGDAFEVEGEGGKKTKGVAKLTRKSSKSADDTRLAGTVSTDFMAGSGDSLNGSGGALVEDDDDDTGFRVDTPTPSSARSEEGGGDLGAVPMIGREDKLAEISDDKDAL